MKIIKPYYKFESYINGNEILTAIESIARVCYKSEDLITQDLSSAKKIVSKLIQSGHEAMLEHVSFSVRFVCDRGVSHELVRHRMASYAQESTRFCNYSKDKFGNEITVIEPCFWDKHSEHYGEWEVSCWLAERTYFRLLENGSTPQEARSVLPTSLKTEVVMTANLREWRHFFKLRTAKAAHPQMRELTIPLLTDLKTMIPIIFDDIEVEK